MLGMWHRTAAAQLKRSFGSGAADDSRARALVDAAKGSVDVAEGQDMVVLALRVPRQY